MTSQFHLTRREMDVLKLLVVGKSNREIGEALWIAEGTVEGHLRNIFVELGVRNRVQAAIKGLFIIFSQSGFVIRQKTPIARILWCHLDSIWRKEKPECPIS